MKERVREVKRGRRRRIDWRGRREKSVSVGEVVCRDG